MSDISGIIAIIFSLFFNIVLAGFILKIIRKMKRELSVKNIEDGVTFWTLEVINPGVNTGLRRGEIYSLEQGLTLGRDRNNDLILDDPFASFNHLRFFMHNDRYVIEDLKSTNGTRLNGEKLSKKTYLKLKDLIEVGSAVFRITT